MKAIKLADQWMCRGIDGWEPSKESINPATGFACAEIPCATKMDIERTLDAAQKGKKVWSAMSFNQRAEIL